MQGTHTPSTNSISTLLLYKFASHKHETMPHNCHMNSPWRPWQTRWEAQRFLKLLLASRDRDKSGAKGRVRRRPDAERWRTTSYSENRKNRKNPFSFDFSRPAGKAKSVLEHIPQCELVFEHFCLLSNFLIVAINRIHCSINGVHCISTSLNQRFCSANIPVFSQKKRGFRKYDKT